MACCGLTGPRAGRYAGPERSGGSGAAEPFEPRQVREEAAVRGCLRVPPGAGPGAHFLHRLPDPGQVTRRQRIRPPSPSDFSTLTQRAGESPPARLPSSPAHGRLAAHPSGAGRARRGRRCALRAPAP